MFSRKPVIIILMAMSLLVAAALILGQYLEVPTLSTYQLQNVDTHYLIYIEDTGRKLAVNITSDPCIINLTDQLHQLFAYGQWDANITFATYKRMILLTHLLTGMVCKLTFVE